MLKYERSLFAREAVKLINNGYQPIFFDESPTVERKLFNCHKPKQAKHILSDNVFKK